MANIINVTVPETGVKVIEVRVPGVQGAQGIQGVQGERGIGIPAGGSTGQIITRLDATTAGWTTLTASLITDSTATGRGVLTAATATAARTTLDAVGNADTDSAATANKVIKRDANGRAAVATPSANGDIATKGYVDGRATSGSLTAATGWTGTASWAQIGKIVTVTVSMSRSGTQLDMAAWTPATVATGLPVASVADNISHAVALTNQYEYGAFSFTTSGTALSITPRWAARVFANGGWLQGSFSYVAA